MSVEGGNFLTHVKETVTILRPMKSSYPRGNAAADSQTPTMSFRAAESIRDDIVAAAAALDMNHTAFIRWAAHAVAVEILKQKNEYDKSRETKT